MTIAVDFTGGLDPAFEYFQPNHPENPEMRDSATLWVIEQSGTMALPRVTLDAIGASWETPWVQLNFVDRDGLTLRVWSQESGSIQTDTNGNAAIRSAGPLRFECIEPFRQWAMEFDGMALQSTTKAEIAAVRDREQVPLKFRFEAEMVAPPWLMGGMTAEAARNMKSGDASALMGGIRYEQICRIRGTLTIGGQQQSIDATGMRVRRKGVRNMESALGHCQHSALFPSGKAFGAIVMSLGPEGPEAFNEAFLIDAHRQKFAARIIRAPWMTGLRSGRDDASLVLDSEIGLVRIEGETLLSMFDHYNFEMANTSILHQGTARYIWDGEETIGLIERCTLRHKLRAG